MMYTNEMNEGTYLISAIENYGFTEKILFDVIDKFPGLDKYVDSYYEGLISDEELFNIVKSRCLNYISKLWEKDSSDDEEPRKQKEEQVETEVNPEVNPFDIMRAYKNGNKEALSDLFFTKVHGNKKRIVVEAKYKCQKINEMLALAQNIYIKNGKNHYASYPKNFEASLPQADVKAAFDDGITALITMEHFVINKKGYAQEPSEGDKKTFPLQNMEITNELAFYKQLKYFVEE